VQVKGNDLILFSLGLFTFFFFGHSTNGFGCG